MHALFTVRPMSREEKLKNLALIRLVVVTTEERAKMNKINAGLVTVFIRVDNRCGDTNRIVIIKELSSRSTLILLLLQF